MTGLDLLAAGGAGLGWFGAAILTLSEARRGLALGLALAALGLALALLAGGRTLEAVAVAAGGGAGAGLRLRDGGGWGILPPGSTPRLILALVLLTAAVYTGGTLITDPGAPARVAALAIGGQSAARLLTTARRPATLTAAGALALAIGVLGSPMEAVGGALVAAGLGLLRSAESRELSA